MGKDLPELFPKYLPAVHHQDQTLRNESTATYQLTGNQLNFYISTLSYKILEIKLSRYVDDQVHRL